MGGEDGGAEGEEGDDDAVQHHPRQQEPEKRDAWLVGNAFSMPSEIFKLVIWATFLPINFGIKFGLVKN